jgi:hypothetical protein
MRPDGPSSPEDISSGLRKPGLDSLAGLLFFGLTAPPVLRLGTLQPPPTFLRQAVGNGRSFCHVHHAPTV